MPTRIIYDYSQILLELPPFAQEFINHMSVKGSSGNTCRSYTYELRRFFSFCSHPPKGIVFPSFPEKICDISIEHMSDLKHEDIESYLSFSKNAEKNGGSALARKQAVVKSLFKYLTRKKVIPYNITLDLEPIKVTEKVPKALEPNEVVELTDLLESGAKLSQKELQYYEHTQKRNLAIFLTFIGTGMRLIELCALDLSDLDFSRGFALVLSKGGNEGKVPLNAEVVDALKDYIENERPKYARKKTAKPVFLSIRGNRISRTAVASMVDKYMQFLKDEGYQTEDFSPHKLRSTAATYLYRVSGGNLPLVQEFMRHKDPRTTRKYTKVLDVEIKRAAEEIKFRKDS